MAGTEQSEKCLHFEQITKQIDDCAKLFDDMNLYSESVRLTSEMLDHICLASPLLLYYKSEIMQNQGAAAVFSVVLRDKGESSFGSESTIAKARSK